jgi:hypothetical protein
VVYISDEQEKESCYYKTSPEGKETERKKAGKEITGPIFELKTESGYTRKLRPGKHHYLRSGARARNDNRHRYGEKKP